MQSCSNLIATEIVFTGKQRKKKIESEILWLLQMQKKKNYRKNREVCYHEKILNLILIGRLFIGNISSLWLLCSVLIARSKFSSHKQLWEVAIILHGSGSSKQRKKASKSFYPAVVAISLLRSSLARSGLPKKLASLFNTLKLSVIKQALCDY